MKRENPKKAAQDGAAEPKREKARRQETETNEKAAPAEQPKKTSVPAAEQAKKPADPAQAPAQKAPASSESQTKQSARKKSNWADQVQKAMEAIGQEQQ